MVFEFNINRKCNYNCSYCDMMHANEQDEDFDFDGFKYYIKQFDNINDKHLVVYGGEPTLYKDFKKVITFLSLYFKNISIITNGSKIISFNHLKIMGVTITYNLSFHKEYHNIEKFINQFKDNKNIKSIAYIYHESDKDLKIYNQLKDNFNTVNIVPLLNSKLISDTSSTKTMENLKDTAIYDIVKKGYFFRETPQHYSKHYTVINNLNHYSGKLCHMNDEVAFFTPAGACHCYLDTITKKITAFKEYKLAPTICKYSLCHCDLPKNFRIKE